MTRLCIYPNCPDSCCQCNYAVPEPKPLAQTLLRLIADSDVREYTDEESAAIRWLEGIAA